MPPSARPAGRARRRARALRAFAPVSGAESALLRFVSGYFLLNGALALGLTVLGLGMAVASRRVPDPLGVGIGLVSAAGLLWTGRAIGRGERRGGQLALVFLLLPLLPACFGAPLPGLSLTVAVLGCAALAGIWRELA